MRIGVYYNQKRVNLQTAQNIIKLIQQKGSSAVLFSDANEITDVERLLVLGGDGTILHSAQRASHCNIPIVGVNYGTRGFLAEFDKEDTERAIDFILDEQAYSLKRSMIRVSFRGKTWNFLNDISLLRDTTDEECKAAKISLRIDGDSASEFYADGLIVSTPTGSTAYSLSAGGCILTPDCETLILTPICAFSLRSRPIVCSDKSTLSLTVEGASLALNGDGIYLGIAHKGDVLSVEKSNLYTTFLTKDKSEFFRRLTKKIN